MATAILLGANEQALSRLCEVQADLALSSSLESRSLEGLRSRLRR